jgi:cysteine desulfurase family protein
MARIYLDNGATSWPKPEAVYDAVDAYQRTLGAPAGRGTYAAALEVDRRIDRTRWRLARLIDAGDPRQIVFCYSGTDALSLALRGLLRPGDHVVTSVFDHNSVLRPLRHEEACGRVEVTRLAGSGDGCVTVDEVRDALTERTRLVVLTHASNVTGVVQPIEAIGQLLQSHPALLLVDAAQTVGHLPLSVRRLQCDFLAAPAHKGLLAPTGTGFLYVAPGREAMLEPLRYGGTGTSSESDEAPRELPAKYEAGNLNAPGLVGLEAALAWLEERTVEAIAAHGQRLGQLLRQGLSELPQVTVYGPAEAAGCPRAPLLSFNVDDLPSQETAILLNQLAGIEVRAGFHCAPRMHASLQTAELGGTVRASWGPFTTEDEIHALLATLAQILP